MFKSRLLQEINYIISPITRVSFSFIRFRLKQSKYILLHSHIIKYNPICYQKITKCSKATATRDLIDLLEAGVFIKRPGEGRSTSYDLNL
ncbi:MAG: hypothetical protein O3C63_08970 [Cyanobacteria bacterium]|nr:hypothetical protein [Cyanobacteriota bacterium]